jgi:hypothetical protein
MYEIQRMEDILHTRCISGSRDFNIVIDAASLQSHTKNTMSAIHSAYLNRPRSTANVLFNTYTLNPAHGFEAYTTKSFESLLQRDVESLKIQGASDTMNPQIIEYNMPVLSGAIVLPVIEHVASFNKLMLELEREGAGPELLTPSKFLARLQSFIQRIQKVLHHRMEYIHKHSADEVYVRNMRMHNVFEPKSAVTKEDDEGETKKDNMHLDDASDDILISIVPGEFAADEIAADEIAN